MKQTLNIVILYIHTILATVTMNRNSPKKQSKSTFHVFPMLTNH